jgi:hypothetical protein
MQPDHADAKKPDLPEFPVAGRGLSPQGPAKQRQNEAENWGSGKSVGNAAVQKQNIQGTMAKKQVNIGRCAGQGGQGKGPGRGRTAAQGHEGDCAACCVRYRIHNYCLNGLRCLGTALYAGSSGDGLTPIIRRNCPRRQFW